MELLQQPNESNFEFQHRLVYGKLVDKTLSDVDYTELAEALYGQSYAPDVARRMVYGSKRTLDSIAEDVESNITDSGLLSELETKKIELQKERQKFFDQRNAYNKIVRDRARQEELNEIITNAVNSGSLPELDYKFRAYAMSDTDIMVSLNDIHYGADISNAWCTYNSDVCKEMMQKYLAEVIRIGDRHGCENCYVVCAGDSISGNIHYSIAVTNKENVIEQIVGVSELISMFIAELSQHFKKVIFIDVAGNHSRINPDKDQSLTGERLDNLVAWYLKARLQNYPNVVIDMESKLDDTMSLFEVRGLNYALIHGDFDGSASKVQALQTMARKPLYAVLCGHKHHNSSDEVQGIKVLMAGSFQGMDDYCVQKRIYGKPEQMVCICDESGIQCQYDIEL